MVREFSVKWNALHTSFPPGYRQESSQRLSRPLRTFAMPRWSSIVDKLQLNDFSQQRKEFIRSHKLSYRRLRSRISFAKCSAISCADCRGWHHRLLQLLLHGIVLSNDATILKFTMIELKTCQNPATKDHKLEYFVFCTIYCK